MPTRIIRDGILTSERVNSLSERAELFYRRLMSVCDDYGRFSANRQLLRSYCYPLRVDDISLKLIEQWLGECSRAGLVIVYAVEGKEYLQMIDFGQRTQSKSKHPEPPADSLKSTVIHRESPGKTALVGVGVGVECEVEGERKRSPTGSRLPADWSPSEADIAFAKKQRPDVSWQTEADKFRDYWHGVAGAKGRKADWPGTWRNWIRRADAPKGSAAASPSKHLTGLANIFGVDAHELKDKPARALVHSPDGELSGELVFAQPRRLPGG